MVQTKIRILNDFPSLKPIGAEFLLIIDNKLKKNAALQKWLSHQGLVAKLAIYWVLAGEKLKAIESYPTHALKIQNLLGDEFGKSMKVISIGGGSVGDFAGFFASTYKRGLDFIQIPSTVLAAIDSAHGGKNGLNLKGVKNQIGTIHHPSYVFIVKKLFQNLASDRWIEGYGELYKIAWISGSPLWARLNRLKNLDMKAFWPLLLPAIRGKYNVVKKDPNETKGVRHLLNLGHTLGHVFESYFELPHGLAVLAGMDFAFFFSAQRSYLKMPRDKIFAQKSSVLLSEALAKSRFRKLNFPALLTIPQNDLRRLLAQDKKRTKGSMLRFVFPVRPGLCRIESVTIEELMQEFIRQKKFFHSL